MRPRRDFHVRIWLRGALRRGEKPGGKRGCGACLEKGRRVNMIAVILDLLSIAEVRVAAIQPLYFRWNRIDNGVV